eukprot:g20175.t1
MSWRMPAWEDTISHSFVETLCKQITCERKRVAIANQYFAEVVEEWHAVKSSPGPRCVMVEYPMPFDWQCDVQVYEAPQQRCIHRLVDGMPSCRLEEIMELVVAAVSEDGPAQRAGVKEGDRLISIGMRSDSWNSKLG